MFKEFNIIHNDCNFKSKVLTDSCNHTLNWRAMLSNSMTTSTHEVNHAISADIRNNKFKNEIQSPKNGFYLLNNTCIIFTQPKILKSQASEYISKELRGFRYGTYVTGQTAWEDSPLYILEEWNCYIAGSSCAIELAEMGNTSPKGTDISSGPVEFLMYSMGLVLAIEKRDKDYFTREPNFLPFCSYQAARALKTAEKCNEYFPWDATKKYLDLWNSNTCKAYREILGETPIPTPKPLNPEDFAQA